MNAPHRAPYYQLAANVPGFPRVGGSEPAFVGARLRPTMRANWRVIASRPGSDGRVNWLPFSIASAPVPGCNSGPTSAVFPGPHHLLKAGFRVGKTKVQMAKKIDAVVADGSRFEAAPTSADGDLEDLFERSDLRRPSTGPPRWRPRNTRSRLPRLPAHRGDELRNAESIFR